MKLPKANEVSQSRATSTTIPIPRSLTSKGFCLEVAQQHVRHFACAKGQTLGSSGFIERCDDRAKLLIISKDTQNEVLEIHVALGNEHDTLLKNRLCVARNVELQKTRSLIRAKRRTGVPCAAAANA